MTTGRFRALGGTTLKWGGQILELNDEDFEARPWVEGSGWPISKAELAPYYEQALVLEGLGECATGGCGGLGEHRADRCRSLMGCSSTFRVGVLSQTLLGITGRTLSGHAGLTVYLHANAVEVVLKEEKCAGVRLPDADWSGGGVSGERVCILPWGD